VVLPQKLDFWRLVSAGFGECEIAHWPSKPDIQWVIWTGAATYDLAKRLTLGELVFRSSELMKLPTTLQSLTLVFPSMTLGRQRCNDQKFRLSPVANVCICLSCGSKGFAVALWTCFHSEWSHYTMLCGAAGWNWEWCDCLSQSTTWWTTTWTVARLVVLMSYIYINNQSYNTRLTHTHTHTSCLILSLQ